MTDIHTSGEIETVRAETRRAVKVGAYFWLVMICTSLASSAGAILVSVVNTQRVQAQQEHAAAAVAAADQRLRDENVRKWCAVIITLDDSYQQVPPKTDAGRNVAAKIHDVRVGNQCKIYK